MDAPKDTVLNIRLRRAICEWIYSETEGVVQNGLFKGMKLMPSEGWHDDNISSMILGCYEQELHDILRKEIERLKTLPSPKIVNIGCAQGYYAIGLSKLVPNAIVYGIDTSVSSLAIADQAALLNDAKVKLSLGLNGEMSNPDFVFSDCEGAEFEYLDLYTYPGLAGANILFEAHDGINDKPIDLTNIIVDRFKDTHVAGLILEGGRNPSEYDILRNINGNLRWLAVSEGRPYMMHWIILYSKKIKNSIPDWTGWRK